ncbi:MAG: DUF1598 domain-containing protein [Planctomycetia bacterium]|nr:DUF1598 domain-containing protein [Planctomycetia bacterium]
MLGLADRSWAQIGGGNGNGNQGPAAAGVAINAEGVLSVKAVADPQGRLTRERVKSAVAGLAPDLAKGSELRKISLTRLEAAVAERIAAGQPLTDEMKYLAGLTRVQYVFFYPESGDIVIAGPAEPWFKDLTGRVCGAKSGRAIVELQDLVVALRAYPPAKKNNNLTVMCSIDPTKEGLARMQQFLNQVGPRATPNDTQFIVNGLRQSLGLQNVTIDGVPADTHFAQVMVEADYRMKLIGIGLEEPPVKMITYVAKATPAGVSRNALARWFFVPDYECVRVADDALAMELVGEGVKLVGENEVVGDDGSRAASKKIDGASQAFVTSFTKKYPELAARSPVYAQLRNCIDVLVAAAFIQQQDYYGQANWKAETLGDEEKVPVRTCAVPKQADTAVNSLWKGSRLMTPVGGGVHIEPAEALKSDKLLKDEQGKVRALREGTKLNLAKGQWWWD